MSRSLIVVQHHPAEGPGRIADWAARRGVHLDIVDATAGALPRPDPRTPWVLLGGPAQVDQPPAWLSAEIELVGHALQADVPLLGICLGAQIIASALGASVARLAEPETGWCEVRFANGDRQHFLQWHSQGFDVPPGAQHLADSEGWPCQMFRRDRRVIGLQFHPEWDAAMVQRLHHAFGAECPLSTAKDPLDTTRHAHAAAWLEALLDDWYGG